MDKGLCLVMLVLSVVLPASLLSGDGSLPQYLALKRDIDQQRQANAALRQRNQTLAERVAWLKSGLPAVETLAREEMGMITEGETFYRYGRPASRRP